MLKFKRVLIFFLWYVPSAFSASHSVVLENSTLLEFSQVVADMIDRPVIISTDLNKPFSISATFKTDADLIALLKSAVLSSGFKFDERGKALVISSEGFLDNPDFKTKTYALKHVPSDYALKVFQTILRSSVSSNNKDQKSVNLGNSFNPVAVDSPSSNSLVITATRYQHKNIALILKRIDVPQKQILIEAVISEVSDKDFEGLDTKLELASGLNSVSSDLQQLNPTLGFSLKLLNSKSLRFFLDYIETSDHSRVLSQPKIIVLNRREGLVTVGQNVPFITGRTTSQASDTQNPFQTIVRQNIGLKLRVKPIVLPSGLIQLDIYQENSSVTNDTSASDIITNVRSFSSQVLLKDGQTVLLGGLTSDSFSKGETGSIPILSDIPVLGWLFSSHKDSDSALKLMVMITAKLIETGRPVPGETLADSPAPAAQVSLSDSDVSVTHHYKSTLFNH